MDLYKVIQDLHQELERLNLIIASLEELQVSVELPAEHKRGRKSMDAGERRTVSQRMKKYWATQREDK